MNAVAEPAPPPRRGRPPDAERRERLLAAAYDELVAAGLAGFSVRAVAARAGTSPRMVLHYFGSRRALMAEALTAARARVLVDAPPPEATAEGIAAADALWRRMAAPEGRAFLRLFFEVYGQALNDPDAWPGFAETAVATWLALVTDGLVAAGVPADEAETRATLLLAAERGLLLDLATTDDDARVHAAHDALLADLTDRLAA
jgi:AcrR family transcriptional regulator